MKRSIHTRILLVWCDLAGREKNVRGRFLKKKKSAADLQRAFRHEPK